MYLPTVRCNSAAALMQPHVFFILAKGPNAGQPSFKPWVNSFQVICSDNNWFDFYFWLCFGLFKAGRFQAYQRGTAIPFINKGDVEILFREQAPVIYPKWKQYKEMIEALTKLERRKESLNKQIRLTEQMQACLIQSYFMQ